MLDWFEWNGKKCTDYGMRVLNLPGAVMAAERVDRQTVPGRSGSLTFLEGEDDDEVFDDINMTCGCIIEDPYMTVSGTSVSRISAICGWLKGEGTVVFANRPEGFYKARLANQISFSKVVRGNPHMGFQVQFVCKPYFYANSGEVPVTTTTASTTLKNPGNVASKPLLKVRGSGEGTIISQGASGGKTLFINSLDGIDYLMLDCDAKIAYKGAKNNAQDPLTLLGSRVSGDWPVFYPGTSFLGFSGGITSIEYTPRWRSVG